MTNLTYFPLADDLIGGLAAGAVTILNPDSDYPAARIQTEEMADVARGGHPTKVRIDFGTNRKLVFWASLNMNNTGGGPIVRSFDDSGYTTPSGDLLQLGPRLLDAKGYSAAMNSRRYWEVDYSTCAPNQTFQEVGKIVAGLAVRTFAQGHTSFKRAARYKNLYNDTPGGTRYAVRLEDRRNALTFSWDASQVDPVVAEVLELLDLTHGGASPLVVIPDNDEDEFYYVRANDQLSAWAESYRRSYLQGMNLTFEELARGRIQVEA